MIKQAVLVIVFLGVSSFLTSNFVQQARKITPATELAVGSSLGTLYELNDQLDEQASELEPNGELSYDEISDTFSLLSELFDGLRFETLGEAFDDDISLATSLELLQSKIIQDSELLDEYAAANAPKQQLLAIEALTSGERLPLIDQVERSYDAYNQGLVNALKQTRTVMLAAWSAFLLALAWLIYSALQSNRILARERRQLESKLDLKGQELDIAETLFDEQKKLSDSNEITHLLTSAEEQADTVQKRLGTIKSHTLNYRALSAALTNLSTELSKSNRDKKLVTEFMLGTVKEYKNLEIDKNIDESEATFNNISEQLDDLKSTLNRMTEAINSRPVIEQT